MTGPWPFDVVLDPRIPPGTAYVVPTGIGAPVWIVDDVPPDRYVIRCNYREGTRSVAQGAAAYVVRTNPGGGNDRIMVLARSRGGRWIVTWANCAKLENFRVKTLPPGHPRYADERLLPAEHGLELVSSTE